MTLQLGKQNFVTDQKQRFRHRAFQSSKLFVCTPLATLVGLMLEQQYNNTAWCNPLEVSIRCEPRYSEDYVETMFRSSIKLYPKKYTDARRLMFQKYAKFQCSAHNHFVDM